MDAVQPSNRYMGTGHPPSMADPQYQQQQQGLPHPPPPSHWYNHPPPPHSHYQYNHHHPPPPPQQQQWQPSPSPPPYAPHPLPPYPAHPHPYASPRPPHHPPPPPPPPQHQQPYPPQLTQSWGNPNFVRRQGWEHPDRNVLHGNEEDWAARARAWAAAKAASENQHAPSQFTPIGRIEDHNHAYSDQYQQTVDPHFTDIQKSSLPVSSSPQMPVPVTNPHRSSSQVLPESASFSSGSSSYVSDVPVSYNGRDGAPYSMSPSRGSFVLSSSIYQQEVPSSYSTIPGHGGSGSQNEKFDTPLPPAVPSHQEPHPHSWPPPVPATGRSSMEQLQVIHQDPSAESAADAHHQSSDFEHGPHQPANYMHPDPAGVVAVASSMHSWTSGTGVTPGAAFPPIPPQGPQFDLPPPVPGHATSMFGRISGPGFRPGIPPVGPAFGLSTGTALHSPTAFPGDTNGVFNVSERPKKASVPNWLREEIIKKKAVIASSSTQDQPAEDSFNSVGAEGDEKPMRRSNQVDNKSGDSTRSNDDEEDDEDDVEAARTAAINQEIKRILTEVLLKVTDELFDEIATKVLSEDDLIVEVENGSELVNHKVSPPPTVSTPKASTEVLIPVKVKKNDTDDATEKSTSSSPGDVLGLANYASDDDDDEDDVGSLHPTKQTNGTTHPRSDDTLALKVVPEAEGMGASGMSTEVSNGVEGHMQSSAFRNGTNQSLQSSMNDVPRKGSPHTDNELICDGGSPVANEGSGNPRGHIPVETERIVGSSHQHTESSDSKDNFKRKDLVELKPGHGNAINERPVSGGSQVREAQSRFGKEESHEGKRTVGKDFVLGINAVEVRTNQKHSDSGVSKKGSGRDVRNGKGIDERNSSSREKEKTQESEPRSSHGEKKDGKKETEKAKPVNGKEDSNRKKDRRRDEMEDRSRHCDERDSHRYKRRRSPSVGSRAKDSKENSLVIHASASDDETSENSRHRKSRSNRGSLSRSPTRSRRRQVSRSPHSKRSQRRHSPYSSHEGRRRRSRSSTPVRPRR